MSEDASEEITKLEMDCAVCLQKCHHPTKLPCGHIFCFLCVKGVAIQSKRCAMCRAEIPSDYLDHPVLLENFSDQETNTDNQEEYQWFYEGRNGWWKYDERSNYELESSFNGGEAVCTLLLAGALYIIDFQSMTQFRRSDFTRRRRVKRDTPSLPAKGIAGIKTEVRQTEQTKIAIEENSNPPSNEAHSEDIIVIDDDDDNVNNEVSGSPDNDDDDVIVISNTMSRTNLRDTESQDIVAEET